MEKKIIIKTVGLPASGKSTWARKFVESNTGWVRVNRDDIRNMLGEYWVPSRENLVTQIEQHTLLSSLQSGYNVVLDATNFNSKVSKWLENVTKQLSKKYEVEVQIKDFSDVDVDVCIERDKKRPNGVGAKVIKQMAEKYMGFVDLFTPKEKVEGLPVAIICDLDGTLAKNNGHRSFYEYSHCDKDDLVPHVREILNRFQKDHKIIYLSGREDGVGRTSTMKFLKMHNCPDGPLYMRKEGDGRSDRIIKKELFDEFVSGKYNVEFVLDDRNQVVKMWRELGLYCLQVADGNF